MMKWSLIAGAATAALFAAGAANASNKVKYDCRGGTVLTVTFKDGKARVTVPGAEPVMLSQGPSGDGFYYARKSYSLRGVGNKVTWSTGRGKPLTCRAR